MYCTKYVNSAETHEPLLGGGSLLPAPFTFYPLAPCSFHFLPPCSFFFFPLLLLNFSLLPAPFSIFPMLQDCQSHAPFFRFHRSMLLFKYLREKTVLLAPGSLFSCAMLLFCLRNFCSLLQDYCFHAPCSFSLFGLAPCSFQFQRACSLLLDYP